MNLMQTNPRRNLIACSLFVLLSLVVVGCDDTSNTPDGSVDADVDAGSDADADQGGDADEPAPVSLILRAPNGGEQWPVDSTQLVMWSASGIEQLHIEFSPDDGETWYDIAASVDATLGRQEWTIPDRVSATCQVRISDPDDAQPSDRSAAPFEIVAAGTDTITVTSPAGGELWREGDEQEITWVSTGAVATVDIALSDDNGDTWTDVATGEESDGAYTWTVPGDIDSIRCKIRVQSAGGDPVDISEPFAIRPPLPPED